MKSLLLVLSLGLVVSLGAHAEDIFRIEIGRDYKNYTDSDLRRRVWELERAIGQLQTRVFQLELGGKLAAAPPSDTWVCTIKAMGEPYVGTGGSRPVATAKAIEVCKDARGDGFFCKDPKCEN